MAFCLEHPKRDQTPNFTPPKRNDELPRPFLMRVPPLPTPLPGKKLSQSKWKLLVSIKVCNKGANEKEN